MSKVVVMDHPFNRAEDRNHPQKGDRNQGFQTEHQ